MEDDRWDRRCSETEMRALRERGLTSGAYCAAGARARAGEWKRLQAELGRGKGLDWAEVGLGWWAGFLDLGLGLILFYFSFSISKPNKV